MEYLGLIIGIVVGAFLIAIIAMEIKNRNKKSDLFTNIVISVIGFGCSFYMLFDAANEAKTNNQFDAGLFFKNPTVWTFIVVVLLSCAFTVVFLTFYFKNKDLPDPVEEETDEEENEVLSDEEIEEILEKENNPESVEEDSTEESEEETKTEEVIEEKTIIENKQTESVKVKEGTSQVPANQRNPFDKK